VAEVESQDRYLTEYAGDVVEFLVDQHEELRTLLARVLAASGPQRQRAWEAARTALERHEAAEEAVLRPLTRQAPGGDALAEARTREEDRASQALALLERYEVDSVSFETEFRTLQEAVLSHAEKEETAEFPLVRRTHDAGTLRRARRAVEEAEAGRRPGPVVPDGGGGLGALLGRARQLFPRHR
jgi:iron-sulfur cluster repair protein YtfE (RIC family)